ncbi:MAG: bifunctional riboflavin kinase/FAD synthetase [Bacteriovoracaceae bacterium]|nr:bifunctional riboflavin kinase/FAD synthetase [Bacteriovoracaceae bacterium]
MQVVENIQEFQKLLKSNEKIGLTIGNFDGFHTGHQYLVKYLQEQTKKRDEKLAVFTFVPHPKFTIESNAKNFLINSYSERRKFFESMKVDYLMEQKFDRDFSLLSASDFLEIYILTIPNLRSLYLGYDFSFGANKQGDFKFANTYLSQRGVEVFLLKKDDSGKNPSSTKIREEIRLGNMSEATRLLGRQFFLDGIVVKGEGRGKKIGFPTANIQFDAKLLTPQTGVYVTRTIYKGMVYHSITNIGINPTFNQTGKIHVETNIFDFNNEIYGEELRVVFLEKVRDEKKFETVNALVEQIKKDVTYAKEKQRDT